MTSTRSAPGLTGLGSAAIVSAVIARPFAGHANRVNRRTMRKRIFQPATCPCPVIRRSTHSRPALAGMSLPELRRQSSAEQSLPRFDRCLRRPADRPQAPFSSVECAGTCHRDKVGFWTRADGWRPSLNLRPSAANQLPFLCTPPLIGGRAEFAAGIKFICKRGVTS